MSFKQNRSLSFVIVAVVYVLATVLGVVLCNVLPYDTWLNILIADVLATVFVFVFSVVLGNASVYDPYWSVQPMVIAVALLVSQKHFTLYNVLLLAVVLLWGIRLTANWAYTFGNLTCQDWRYTMLKQKTKGFYPIINFVGIHMVPTLVVYGCCLPIIFAMQTNVAITLKNANSLFFLAVSLCAVVLQCASDIQMHKFRKDKREGLTTEPFMRRGLWKHSRHPNYLAEILMWWGVGLSGVVILPNSWFVIIGAVANTLLFTFVSIPMADGRQSRKDGFATYKAETFALLPFAKPHHKAK